MEIQRNGHENDNIKNVASKRNNVLYQQGWK